MNSALFETPSNCDKPVLITPILEVGIANSPSFKIQFAAKNKYRTITLELYIKEIQFSNQLEGIIGKE